MYGRTRRFEGRILRRGVSVSSEGKTGEKCDGFSVASSCPREQNQPCNNIKQTILIGGQDFFPSCQVLITEVCDNKNSWLVSNTFTSLKIINRDC